jgi:hypothetical protein
MTNQQVRQWYREKVGKIPGLNRAWIMQGMGIESRARMAWQIRHDARLGARDLMENQTEVRLLRDRDLELYGHSDGPSFDYLVTKAHNLGLRGDNIFEAIINDSYTTNAEIDNQYET